MSLAPQAHPSAPAASPWDVPPSLDGPFASLADLGLRGGPQAHALGGQDAAWPSTAAADGTAAAALTALLGAQATQAAPSPADALRQLAAQMQAQQQQAVLARMQGAAADPALLSLGNLLAAQQGLSARVGELMALKRTLQGGPPPPRSTGGGGIRGTGPIANPLFKTELCRSWEETGSCCYGGKCQFAHGRKELRPVVRHPKYKTEHCRTFSQTGTCPYGTRCRFIHSSGLASSPALGGLGALASPGGYRASSAPPAGDGTASPLSYPASRDASYASLPSLAGSTGLPGCSTPPTPSPSPYAPAHTPGTPSPLSFAGFPPSPSLPPPPTPPAGQPGYGLAAHLGGGGLGGGSLGGGSSVDAGTIAALLGLPGGGGGGAAGVSGYASDSYAAASFGGGASLGGYSATAAAAGFGLGGMSGGGMAAFQAAGGFSTSSGQAGGASYGQASANEATLAALTALLSGSAGMPPAPASPLTTAAAALGVLGAPSGLPPLTAAARLQTVQLSAGAAPFSSCPSTPVGTPAPGGPPNLFRRTADCSEPSTPGGGKRLPIFERLLSDSDRGTRSSVGSRRTSADTVRDAPSEEASANASCSADGSSEGAAFASASASGDGAEEEDAVPAWA